MSVSLRENITAVIETCFSETKDEIQDTAINRILELIRANCKTENNAEKLNNCEPQLYEIGYHDGFHQAMADEEARMLKSAGIYPKTELQTIRCPKCGRTDYIRDMEKDMGIKGSYYKYKCINCNTYIKDEPTISKMEQVDKDINVCSKTVLTGETNARIVDKWEREMTERSG